MTACAEAQHCCANAIEHVVGGQQLCGEDEPIFLWCLSALRMNHHVH
jgi:hypothetical protein